MPTFPDELHSTYAWDNHKVTCAEFIRRGRFTSICEIGGGRDPLFTLDEVAELGIDYTVLDISADELALVPDGYRTLAANVCDPALAHQGEKFDFVFSKMLAEHVPDGRAMHRNLFCLLRPGGQAFHFFPTLYSPAFVVNRLLPERITTVLQSWSAPRPKPKIPAHYSLCRGPTPRTIRVLNALGFLVKEYRPFYGSDGYFERLPVLRELEAAMSRWAAGKGNPYLTTFAFVLLEKPAARAA